MNLFAKLTCKIPGQGNATSFCNFPHCVNSEVPLLMPCLHLNTSCFTRCACSSRYIKTVLQQHSSHADLFMALRRWPDNFRCPLSHLMTPQFSCLCFKVRSYLLTSLWQLLQHFHLCSLFLVFLPPISLVGIQMPWSLISPNTPFGSVGWLLCFYAGCFSHC